jgi:hypothetical protein
MKTENLGMLWSAVPHDDDISILEEKIRILEEDSGRNKKRFSCEVITYFIYNIKIFYIFNCHLPVWSFLRKRIWG